MNDSNRERWDERYRSGAYAARTHPTELLAEWLPRLPRGRALDVPCGAGRNALYLAQHGYAVDAIDISSVALERARTTAAERNVAIRCMQMDVTSDPLPEKRYDLIVMVRYRSSALIPALIERLDDGGYLLCEEHLRTHRAVVGPENPDFRVRPNELLSVATGLRVVYYHEGLVDEPDGAVAALAQLIGCRGSGDF